MNKLTYFAALVVCLTSCKEEKPNNLADETGTGVVVFEATPRIRLKARSKEELAKYTLEEIHPELSRLRKIQEDESTSYKVHSICHEEIMMLYKLIDEKVEQNRIDDAAKIKDGTYKKVGEGAYQTERGILIMPGGSVSIPLNLDEQKEGWTEVTKEDIQEFYDKTSGPTFVGVDSSDDSLKYESLAWNEDSPTLGGLFDNVSLDSLGLVVGTDVTIAKEEPIVFWDSDAPDTDLTATVVFNKERQNDTLSNELWYDTNGNLTTNGSEAFVISVGNMNTSIVYEVLMSQEELDEYNEWKENKKKNNEIAK